MEKNNHHGLVTFYCPLSCLVTAAYDSSLTSNRVHAFSYAVYKRNLIVIGCESQARCRDILSNIHISFMHVFVL